jgi:aquaporin Z
MFLTVPVTGGSLNPARSTGIAIIAQNNGQTSALPQLWIFWVVPLLAGAIVGLVLVISSSLKKADADVDVYTYAPEDESAVPASEEDLAEFNATIETEDAPESTTLAFEEVEEATDDDADSDADAASEDDMASEKYEQGSEEK